MCNAAVVAMEDLADETAAVVGPQRRAYSTSSVRMWSAT